MVEAMRDGYDDDDHGWSGGEKEDDIFAHAIDPLLLKCGIWGRFERRVAHQYL